MGPVWYYIIGEGELSMRVEDLSIENIRVKKLDGYSGFDVYFTVGNQDYCFMIAKGKMLTPLAILHHFREMERCHLCNRMVIQAPTGKQPCLALKKIDKSLLEYLQTKSILK